MSDATYFMLLYVTNLYPNMAPPVHHVEIIVRLFKINHRLPQTVANNYRAMDGTL